MPKQRYQKTVLQQTDGKKPEWFIRPWVDVIGANGQILRVKKRYYLGSVASTKKRKATTKANAIMATVNRASYVIQSQIRFGEFLDTYIRLHVRNAGVLAASTQAKYESHIATHIRPAFGELMLCEVDTVRIQAWLNELAKPKIIQRGEKRATKPGLASNTRMDLLHIVSGIFTKAADWGYYQDRNPVERVDAGRKRLARERRKLSDEETRLLLAALPEDVREIVEMALFFTLRISEVMGLQEKHLDFARGLILVRQRWYRGNLDTVKSLKSRRDIPMALMADRLKAKITGQPERFVFSVTTRPRWGKVGAATLRDDRGINQHFLRPAAKAIGVYCEGFGFHALRHQAVTEYSTDPLQAQKMAGHSHMDMTAHYTMSDRAKQEAQIREFQSRILGEPVGGVQ